MATATNAPRQSPTVKPARKSFPWGWIAAIVFFSIISGAIGRKTAPVAAKPTDSRPVVNITAPTVTLSPDLIPLVVSAKKQMDAAAARKQAEAIAAQKLQERSQAQKEFDQARARMQALGLLKGAK